MKSEHETPDRKENAVEGFQGTPSGHRPRKRWTMARHAVQAVAFVLFSIPLIAAGWKLFGMTPGFEEKAVTPAQLPFYGSFASSSIFGLDLLDPLSFLQTAAASRTIVPSALIAALTVIVVYAAIRARAFCGWVCPLGSVLELVDRIGSAMNIPSKERTLPRRTKVWVAIGVIALSAITGIPVFEAVSPISAVHRAMLFGSVVGVWTFVLVVVLELFWHRRVWCRALCPLGGLYEAIGRIGIVKVGIDHETCVRCDRCKDVCPADPAILDPAIQGDASYVAAGDCMACGACVDACPSRSLSMHVGVGRHHLGHGPDRPNP